MRNEITSFRQGDDESLFDAWERFKELLRQCPHHGIPICIQLETFYNGLIPSSRNMLDASSGGALLSKSYEEGYKLIESITANTYQWPVTRANTGGIQKRPAGVHEVTDNSAMAAQLAQIHQMMKTMMSPESSKAELVKIVTDSSAIACVYCGGAHLFEECLANPVSVNYVGNNNNRYNNPYNNTYNPGWRNHPNFSWSNTQNQLKPQVTQPNQVAQAPPGFGASNYSGGNQGNNHLENILKSFIQETKQQFIAQGVSIKNLENQVGQIATAVSARNMGTLPSSTETPSTSREKNVETCKAVKLRSGKEYEGIITEPEEVSPEHFASGKSTENTFAQSEAEKVPDLGKRDSVAAGPQKEKKLVQERPPPPFPQRIRKAKEEQQFGEFLEILKQLHINIPLIEAIEQMPNYSKFMKDMLTKRRRVGEFATVALTQECS